MEATLSHMADDYRETLFEYGVLGEENGYYMQWREPEEAQGWILHVSIRPEEVSHLFPVIIPVLRDTGTPFKVVKDFTTHLEMNKGSFGAVKIGKTICIYLPDGKWDNALLKFLVETTSHFYAPVVITDYHLGGNVYTRYGSYRNNILQDTYGNLHRVLSNGQGGFMEDKYYTPAQNPLNLPFPLDGWLKTGEKPPKLNWLFRKYLQVSVLSSQPKGRVFKAVRFSRGFVPVICVIKEGVAGFVPDQAGRDIRDRLKWQYDVAKRLEQKIKLAKGVELILEGKQSYIVMDYLEGISICQVVMDLAATRAFFNLDASERVMIFDTLIEVLAIVKTIHASHFIHRDITGNNFLLTKKRKVLAIDLELVYSTTDQLPSPPFALGTFGFMSPAQQKGELPTFADDIYSLGALILELCAPGIDPIWLMESDRENLREKVDCLLRDRDLVNLIMDCTSLNPSDRPALELIEKKLDRARSVARTTEKFTVKGVNFTKQEIAGIIDRGILALGSDRMSTDGVWYSSIQNPYDADVYPMVDKHFFLFMSRGVSGVLHFFSEALKCGCDIRPAYRNIAESMDYLEREILARQAISQGLHFGVSGIALAACSCMDSGLIPSVKAEIAKKLVWYLSSANPALNLINGCAGDGLAIMQCKGLLDQEQIAGLTGRITEQIISKQQKDGSFLFPVSNNEEDMVTGFGYGMAGVLYYLLEYATRFEASHVIKYVTNGLNYLIKTSSQRGRYIYWKDSLRSKDLSKWWCQGGPGISLLFLRAYEILGNEQYCEIAEDALRIHPENIVCPNLGQCHGLSGLGEIYLEAFRVTGKREWQTRADWIAELICSLKISAGEEGYYWKVEDYTTPYADLMMGNAGVLRFLLRYVHPDKLGFPLLPV